MSELPLTPIERYFYHDHRESHPAWIRYEFAFQGALDRAALGRAWERIAQRHRLTTATVAPRRWGRPVWQIGAAQPELVWREGDATAAGRDAGDLHDLSVRAGLLGIVGASAAETHLTLLVHHAVSDGLGLLVIAEDLFGLYAVECGAEMALLEIAALSPRRDRGSPGGAGWWRQLPWIFFGVGWGVVLGWQRVVEMRGAGGSPRRRELPGRSCSVEDTVRLRKTARAAGASLNEMLICVTQVTLGVWLQRHGTPQPEDWTRLLVPVYVGGPRTDARCSANALGVALIDRRVRSLGRRARLLQRAHEDMDFIVRRGLARAFRASMWLMGLIPGQIARYCRRAGARSTLAVSNLGRCFGRGPLVRPDGVLTVPGAELKSFSAWGPCRPGTGIFVGTGTYRGEQSLWVSYDPTALSVAQAEDFVDEMERQIACTLAGE